MPLFDAKKKSRLTGCEAGIEISDFGFRNADFGFEDTSAIPLPPSEILIHVSAHAARGHHR